MKTRGITLMSVMVSTVLLGIVALAVTRLIANQSVAVRSLNLVAERRQLLEHYRNVVIGGWDNTRKNNTLSGAIAVYDRSGTSVIIPAAGLTLGQKGLYEKVAAQNAWWKVTASASTKSGVKVTHSHKPDTDKEESLVTVTLAVEFDPDKHPSVGTKFKKVEEKIFLQNNVHTASIMKATICDSSNKTHKSKLDKNSDTFYEGEAAIVQYDFKSNYTRCSQVPLVDLAIQADTTHYKNALRGFQRNDHNLPSTDQRITGKPAYTIKHVTGTAPSPLFNYITLKETDCGEGKYFDEIDKDGKPKCSSNYVGTDQKDCLITDPENGKYHSYNNNTKAHSGPSRGGIKQVDSSGVVTCIDVSELGEKADPNDPMRGDNGANGQNLTPTVLCDKSETCPTNCSNSIPTSC